mmetsp:Transcript_13496/g.18004  ORF Transcript_13496/g.18004 Transcript_13496/m.18004 type:complete len:236 (+) Transcript_13496:975-1682(+)
MRVKIWLKLNLKLWLLHIFGALILMQPMSFYRIILLLTECQIVVIVPIKLILILVTLNDVLRLQQHLFVVETNGMTLMVMVADVRSWPNANAVTTFLMLLAVVQLVKKSSFNGIIVIRFDLILLLLMRTRLIYGHQQKRSNRFTPPLGTTLVLVLWGTVLSMPRKTKTMVNHLHVNYCHFLMMTKRILVLLRLPCTQQQIYPRVLLKNYAMPPMLLHSMIHVLIVFAPIIAVFLN